MKILLTRKSSLAPVKAFLLALALCLTALPALAAGIANVTHLDGVLVAKRADGSQKLLGISSEVFEGDTLSTQKGTYARIRFSDGGEVVLRPNTDFQVTQYKFEDASPESSNIALNLIKGGLRAVTGLIGKRKKENYRLDTATATIGIRGTHYGALFCQGNCADVANVSGQPPADGLHVDVVQGAVSVTNPSGEIIVNAGEFGYVQSITTPPIPVPPTQGIRVTMPNTISSNNSDGHSIGNTDDRTCTVPSN